MKSSVIVLLSCLLISIAVPLSAENLPVGTTGTLAGKVVDAGSKEPLIGVNIMFDKTKLGGETNEKGEYRIFNVPVGTYTVIYSYIGYAKHNVENVLISSDVTTTINVELNSSDIELGEVVVQAERLLLKQDITGTIHVVQAKQIDLMPIDDFYEIIATQPGVTRDLHIRGGRKSEIMYLVDGLPFTEAKGGTAGGMLPKSAILEMKILTGGFDPEYGNALSGVVNIVTRRGGAEKTYSVRGEIDHYFWNPETDYSNLGEVTMSGPLGSHDLTYFMATDYKTSDTRWAQDFRQYFDDKILKAFNSIVKLDYNYSPSIRLNAQLIASLYREKDYEFRWRRNLQGLPEESRKSYRVSVGISQFLTKNTFYNLSISRYHLNSHLGPDKESDLDLNDLFQYDFFLQYVKSGTRLWWADENQTTWTIVTDLTSQYTENNSLKFGGEIVFYNMDIKRVKNEPQLTYFGKPIINLEPLNYSTSYNYRPRSGAAYFQNKFRFVDGGTLSFGARWDFLDPRADRPNLEWVPGYNDQFRQVVKDWVPASIKHRFSPRFGFAMPLTPSDYFFVNFGFFFQVPLFDYLFSGLDINLKKQNSVLVGNPDMRPQVTKAWEFSYRRQFTESVTLTVTMFDKDTENLVDTKTFLASDSKALDDGYYAQYVNSPYANARGIEISLEKHFGSPFFGRFSYSLMEAKGLSERENQGLDYLQWGFDPIDQLYPLSWDQRHTISSLLSSDLPKAITLDLIVNYNSPRPYTYFPSKDGFTTPDTKIQPNNARMENNVYFDFKATKSFKVNKWKFGGWDCVFYLDVRNLLDKSNLLWVASDGVPGGELRDPGAYDMPRRTRMGIQIKFR